MMYQMKFYMYWKWFVYKINEYSNSFKKCLILKISLLVFPILKEDVILTCQWSKLLIYKNNFK